MIRIDSFSDLDINNNVSGYEDWIYVNLYMLAKGSHLVSDELLADNGILSKTLLRENEIDIVYEMYNALIHKYGDNYKYFIYENVFDDIGTIATYNERNMTFDLYTIYNDDDGNFCVEQTISEPASEYAIISMTLNEFYNKKEDLIS